MERTLSDGGPLSGLFERLRAPFSFLARALRRARMAQSDALQFAVLASLTDSELHRMGVSRQDLEAELARLGDRP